MALLLLNLGLKTNLWSCQEADINLYIMFVKFKVYEYLLLSKYS